jgi:hypothetical protein
MPVLSSRLFQLNTRRLFIAVSYPTAIEVVGRKLNEHAVARKNADKVFAHLAGDVRQHLMLVILQLNAKHRIRQGLKDLRHHLYRFFLRHTPLQLKFDPTRKLQILT